MSRAEFSLWLIAIVGVQAATFFFTADRYNWLLDTVWVLIGVPLLLITRRFFPLSPLLYRLLAIHALVLLGGGFWTYEEMPIGLWLKNILHTERNHYDRFGHFMQGFVPAILFRELFIRCAGITRGGWLIYFVLSACLSFSALFELIEWAATVMHGGEGDAFLGHQGDVWDAQWDMLWCLIGAALSLLILSVIHNRSLRCVMVSPTITPT